MKNADQPAFANPGSDHGSGSMGLTKREYFAAMAMQGLISSHPDQAHNHNEGVGVALAWADALLKRLES
jgi:hypothetical protein